MKKNEKEPKIKKNFRTKGVVISSIVAMAVVIALIAMLIINNVTQRKGGAISAELAKAMTYDLVEEGDEIVKEAPNVRFDAFFLRDINNDGYAESIRGTSEEIGDEDTLYMEINVVTAGYLKDAKITINGENFYLQTALPKDDELKNNYIGNNIKTIEFNDLNNGTEKMLTGIVRSGDYAQSSTKAEAIGNNINNYSKVNSVTLTGTYVDENRVETPISKTVEFNVDWYGRTTASISATTQNKNIKDAVDEENGVVNLNFTINTQETNQELILASNHVEGEIPELNGYAPVSVEYTGSTGVFNYDAQTRTFTIDKEAVIEDEENEEIEAGTVITSLPRSNSYNMKVVYPIEAYQSLGAETITIEIPVKTYYEGYNNPSEEFTNPYKSNIASAKIKLTYEQEIGKNTNSSFSVTVGKIVYDPITRYIISKEKPLKIYNGASEEETDDTYTVLWRAYIGTDKNTAGITMKETQNGQPQVTDVFIKTDNTEESTDDVVDNVGIYFTGADTILGSEGWINVYDEDTGNLLVTFTNNDWNKYTSGNPYKYELPVKHIRIETSTPVKDEANLYVYNIKEIDDNKITEKYEKEEFNELEYIKSTLVGYVGEEYISTTTHQANYEAPMSIATISISNNTISTQATEENDIITIIANANSVANQVGWQNGTFLVKLPEEIVDAQINGVEISNGNVSIESYELIEEGDSLFIKIVTKNDIPSSYNIMINVDLSPDPRNSTATRNIELYASNENGENYFSKAEDIYDVNNNLNTTENVNYATTSLSMISPNSLLTNQIATNYDDKGSEIVSPEVADIRPVYAVVDQEREEQTATIGVQIRNNYASTISEIQILGEIPFEGNKYVIAGRDLGSTFTTTITEEGIEIPEELQQYATVYYSENENPDRDINKDENGWKTADQVANWDNIKTYLIDLGDYVMPTGKEYVFNYTVKIPNGLDFNEVSYSHHGVYFCLDTDQGKYRTETEPNKLGFRIAEKFDLELTKYQTGKDKLIPGASYSVTEIITNELGEEEKGEVRTGVTNSQGKLTITNLYAEKEYEIKEIKSPDDYELNGEVIRFIAHVDEEGKLSIEVTQGEPREEITVNKENEENYQVGIAVEDEVKASIKIIKQEQNTETTIQGVRFKLKGYGLPENGRNITTNRDGEITLKGLSINQEYTLEEVKAEGYYLASPIKFKIVNDNGIYRAEVTDAEGNLVGESGTENNLIKNVEITEEDSIPTLNLTLGNETIPTYSLQIIKIKKTVESTVSEDEAEAQEGAENADTEVEYLAGAKFKLYKATEEIGEYTTDETGTITIEGMYQFIADKGIEQTYTLKEVVAPDGYAKVQDITFKVEQQDGVLVLKEINEEGAETESSRYTVEGNTVKLTIEDSPSFKLIKKDSDTGEVLANVKFAIYNVDDGTEQPARNSKGEIIGEKETINGREYYVIKTDENGEITADLTEGLYKAIEVEAPEQYEISDQVYYFGIGASREAPTAFGVTQATNIGGTGSDLIYSVAGTNDGGYIAGGYFASSSITLGNNELTNVGGDDGVLIKYDENGTVKWARTIGGTGDDYIISVDETIDGYIVGGYFNSSSINVSDDYTLTRAGNYDGMLIKFDIDGNVEWATSIGGGSNDQIRTVEGTSDGGYIVGGYFNGNITVDDNPLTNAGSSDGMIIKYDANNEVRWVASIGGSAAEQIESIKETSDEGFLVGGYFMSGNITVGDNYTLTTAGSEDGMVIKYDSSGNVKWANSVGGGRRDFIYDVTETSDGSYIAAGAYLSHSIEVGGYTLTEGDAYNGMVIKYGSDGDVVYATNVGRNGANDYAYTIEATDDAGFIVGGHFSSIDLKGQVISNVGNRDGMIIKYNANNEAEWVKSIAGTSTDFVRSVAKTNDGGYVAGGYFNSSSVDVENFDLTNTGSTSTSDGVVIKLEEIELNNPITIQAQSMGGTGNDQITSVVETNDGGYIVGGYFSSSITVGNYTLTSAGDNDGVVIKYAQGGNVEWAQSIGGTRTDRITSVSETSDGGYIVGGYFSNSITVGDYTLNNAGGNDGIIIKYDADGNVEWATSIGGSSSDQINSIAETRDEGYIIGGYFNSSSIIIGEYTLTNAGNYDGMIIKYNANGTVEWATSIGGSSSDQINSIAETSNGDYIIGGYFNSSSITIGGYTLTNAGRYDGMLVKYNNKGTVEWATSIGGSSYDQIDSIAETKDGGCIIGGYFNSSSIIIGEYTLTNAGNYDGMVIKYNANGTVEWATSIGGSNSEYITSVKETSDEGYIIGGYFRGSYIPLENYVLSSNGGYDGMIIKYNANGIVEWAKNIGGSYDDYINSVIELDARDYMAIGYFQSNTIETNGHTIINNSSSTNYSDGMILKIANQVGVPEIQELTVENNRKEFKITTDVEEIDGVKGGNISGEDRNPYEIVKYGDDNTSEIKMIPETGYEIIKITINGEEILDYEVDPVDGSYTLPQFTNVTEDKHIVVTYAQTSNKITIVKKDGEDETPLSGATFELDQIEERTNPENVIGNITDNGSEYAIVNTENEVTEQVIGELTNNGEYYFVQNEDGTLVPTNSKTYQTTNIEGATGGVANTTANSYLKIDLSGLEGKYIVVTNVSISSENNYDYGYATITQTTTAPEYNSSTGRYLYVTGTSSNTEYMSMLLEGENTYYLHLGYRKDKGTDSGNDQVVINSIKVYEAVYRKYNFVLNGQGGYESSNQGRANTTANSYIPINLTNLTGKYNLTVNANISSESADYGYATVTTSATAPSYSTNNSSSVRFIYISGTTEAVTTPTDYTTVLQGGNMYYLHLGYYKNATIDNGEDKFTVNSINVTLNDSELYHTEITTNENGEATTQIPYGKYTLTELQAPEGYEKIEQPITIEFREAGNSIVENNNEVNVTVGENGEFIIENNETAKVIVHHYFKDQDGVYTTIPIASDELIEGKTGERYTTSPHLDLEKYQLVKDEEGNYIVPDGNNTYYESSAATGTFEPGIQEVIYYYELKDIPLIVHHYIEGTENKVPLSGGNLAEDEEYSGKEGEEYTTEALTTEELSEKYELVEIPENATGTYSGDSVEVTYYYKIKTVEITTRVELHEETDATGQLVEVAGGSISGEKEKPYETVEYGEDSVKDIIAEPEEGYRVSKITVNGEEIEFTANEDGTVELEKFIEMKEDKEVVVSFEKIPAEIIIHHYIYNKETGEYTEEKAPAKDGGVVEDEIRTGSVGDMYASRASENIAPNYEYISDTGNTSGKMTEEMIEVIYYYQLKDGEITENIIEKTGTPEKITKEDQEVSYTISYNATVDEYIGNAVVTIVDYLPYEIDLSASSIEGLEEGDAVYNATEKTITWTERIEEIDTYEAGEAREINISKEITVVYVNMDYSKTSFDNKVQGSIILEETKQEEKTPEVTETTETEFTKTIEVTKEWDHTNNIYGIPEEVKVQVKKTNEEGTEEVVVAEKILNSDNKVTEEDENTWFWTFENLPKYDANGNEIDYTVDEVEVNDGDLDYYRKEIETIDGTEENVDKDIIKITIKNTFNGPVIGASKEIITENNLTYVVEGENIKYTIRVQNSGELAGNVVVKDVIPEGTSFVEGSIRVNGASSYEVDLGEGQTTIDLSKKTAEDLANGIEVNVPGRIDETTPGEVTVSFDVTVDELEGDTLTKEIKNTATVNKNSDDPDSQDEPTNEVTTVVNKADLKYSKSSNPASGSIVKEGDEITYTIHLDNVKGKAPTSALVKDTIPTGTTFVDGSIKVDGKSNYVVGGETVDLSIKTADDLASGILVDIAAGESREIAFKVIVNDLENKANIKNVATVNQNPEDPESPDSPTNETEHKYVEPVITAKKEMITANGLSYVVEGEKITYTIRLENRGDLAGNVAVKDAIPEGTTFVPGSIKVNGQPDANKTADDLANGITVNVPAREVVQGADGEVIEVAPGEAMVSFEVTVDKVEEDVTTKTIRNTGYIDEDLEDPENPDNPTNEVMVPVLIYKKTAEIIRNEENDKLGNNNITEGAVTAGDRIKYTITINNIGEGPITNVEIKDTVPEGTTIFVINDDGEISLNDTNEITWEIDEIAAGEAKEVSFEVTVNYDKEDKTIRNVGTVDGKPTNKVETPYEAPELDLESSIVKDGTQRITNTEEKISYTINYKAEIREFVGKGKLKIVDYLPYAIDEENSELNGGTYNAEDKTITWEEDLGVINTYAGGSGNNGNEDENADTNESTNEGIEVNGNDKEAGVITVERTKILTLKYIYTDEENLSGTIENRAEGTITLTQEQETENPDNPDEPIIEDKVVKEETKEDDHEVRVEIPAKVIVHHHIYDEETGEYTEKQVPSKDGGRVADETINGIVGNPYDTNPSADVNENYECVNSTPDKHEGIMTKTDIEVTYYYKLKNVQWGVAIEKTAQASKQEEREYETGEFDDQGQPIIEKKTVEVLTEEDGVVTYKIKFRVGIVNYKGRATITMVDKLPASLATKAEGVLVDEIDLDVDEEAGEKVTYDKEERTITWTREVDIDTFEAREMYDETFEKEIRVVYKDQDVTATLVNEVTGTVTIYYPEDHSSNPGGERGTNTVTDTAEVEQEYKVAKEVEKVWDDNNDSKENRPDSVTVQLTANGNTSYNGQELEKVVLSDANNWKYTFTNLPKYDEFGNKISYSVVETETNIGDLEYYDAPVITVGDLEIGEEADPEATPNEKIIVTNKYKLMDTYLQSSIDKTGTDKITASNEEVTYNISYRAVVTDYIGEALVRVVDTLPYKLAKDENGELLESIDLAGGTYDEDTRTITWEQRIEHINTYTNGDYEVEINKTIKVVYGNLDATQRSMTNHVKGTIDLYETEQTNKVEDTHDTVLEIPGKVIVKYVDKETGEEITYQEEQEGQEPVEKTYGYEIDGLAGDWYETEQKEIPRYTYVENSGNTEGNMIEGTIEVIYYYEKAEAGGVHVTYVDEDGNEIAEDENYTGKVGDPYTTEQKEIYGYEYVRVEGEPEGEMTEDIIEVVYVYKKMPAKVIVRYLEKDETPEDDSDNKVLYPEETIEGYVGDEYTTNRREIINYQPAEPEPENKEGEMTEEDIYVTYYYEKIPSGKVIAQYVDIDTNEEILYKDEETGEYKTYREESQGYIGDPYETEQKEIPYYKIVEELIPANKDGKYSAEDIYVTYYYEKLTFNMAVDKNVTNIMINDDAQEVLFGKLNKVEVVGSRINSTDVKITYSIKVSNTGELDGTATVVENIPENFKLNSETGSEWRQNEEGNLEAEVVLKAGETKELKVVLNWIRGDNNFGGQTNTVEIVETENPANYEETTTEDNKSEAEVVMGIKTGSQTRPIIFILALTGMLITFTVFLYITEKYVKECKDRGEL